MSDRSLHAREIVPEVFLKIDVAMLYTVKPATYADRYGMSERGAQKLFIRMHDKSKKVPAGHAVYVGLPIIERIGERYRMLTPYFEAICCKTVKENS